MCAGRPEKQRCQRRLGAALLFAVTLTSCVERSGDQEVLKLEKVMNQAWLKHDTGTVSSIVAGDFQGWSATGKRVDKASVLRAVEKNSESQTVVADEQVRIYGKTAIYTARVTDTSTVAGGAVHRETTCITDVFIRRDGRWRLVASHETAITP